MDIRTSTAWYPYPASVNMEKLYYWITPRDQFGNEISTQESCVDIRDITFSPKATNVYVMTNGRGFHLSTSQLDLSHFVTGT